MSIKVARVTLSDEDGLNGKICDVDVIEHGGQHWLVGDWIDNPSRKVTMPARIVLLDVIPHDRAEGSPRYVVSGPIPRSIFDGHVPPGLETQYVVIERPDIKLPLPDVTH